VTDFRYHLRKVSLDSSPFYNNIFNFFFEITPGNEIIIDSDIFTRNYIDPEFMDNIRRERARGDVPYDTRESYYTYEYDVPEEFHEESIA
jgi:hypothetical protein